MRTVVTFFCFRREATKKVKCERKKNNDDDQGCFLIKKLVSPRHYQKPGSVNGSPTCPISDGQVVSLLKDDIQLVHCWTRRLELRITGPDNIDAL